ncbi:MAG: hypothetical protein WCF36_10115 [Candidatus Nanopelagicales bacterium]
MPARAERVIRPVAARYFREHEASRRHAAYTAALARAPLTAETRRTYASKVRTHLAWLDAADVDGDPLTDPSRGTGLSATTGHIWPRS